MMSLASWQELADHDRPLSVEDLVVVRAFEDTDQAAVIRLYVEGLLVGEVDENDTGADLQHVRDEYFSRPQDHLWVAQFGDQIVGMIAVVETGGHIAVVRRLRIDRDWQHSNLPEILIRTALKHCRRFGFIKLVLDVHCDHQRLVELLRVNGFQFTRSRIIRHKSVLEFYVNLYQRPERRPPQVGW